jgi:hypothetical protein
LGVYALYTKKPNLKRASLILSRATVERGEREVVQVPRSADGRSAGPLPLRPPLRWWESGGTSDPCLRRVDSRVGFPGGAGEVVAAALWNKVAGSCSPSRRCSVGCCRRDSGVGLAGVVLAWGTSSLGVFWSSRLLPRAAVAVGSCGSSKLVEEGGDGSGLPDPRRPVLGVRAPRSAEAGLQLLPVLFVVLLQAWRLARAGVLGLTAGEVRGAAPADVALAFARSRRLRRVDVAATSTRSSPLSSSPATQLWRAGASSLLPATMRLRGVRQRIGFCAEDSKCLFVIFCFFRVPSVKWGQLSHVWTILVFSSFLT